MRIVHGQNRAVAEHNRASSGQFFSGQLCITQRTTSSACWLGGECGQQSRDPATARKETLNYCSVSLSQVWLRAVWNQTPTAGSGPSLRYRCGVADEKQIASPATILCSLKPSVTVSSPEIR